MDETTIETMEAEDSLELSAEDFEGETSPEAEAESGAEEEQENADAGEAEGQTEQAPSQEEEGFEIVYNGQKMKLSRQEMITAAQKGMNYDHVYGELQQLRQAPEFALLDRYAAQNGMNRQQYMQALAQAETDRRVQQEVEKGVPEETARRLVNLEQEQARQQQQRAAAQSELGKRQARERQVAEFHKEFPDVTEFPDEVMARIVRGETPVSAYRAYQIEQLNAKIASLEQEKAAQAVTEQNKKKSVGSVSGGGNGNDPFMDAFDSAFGE